MMLSTQLRVLRGSSRTMIPTATTVALASAKTTIRRSVRISIGTSAGRVLFTAGSGHGIGSDPSMVAANDRLLLLKRCNDNDTNTSRRLDKRGRCRFTTVAGRKPAPGHHDISAVPGGGAAGPAGNDMSSWRIARRSSEPPRAATSFTIFRREFTTEGGGGGSGGGSMDDEYGEMTSEGDSYTFPGPYVLESGEILAEATLRYQTYGELNESRDNVLVICHALTGNASLHSWWGDLLGPGNAFDTDRYFVVCANILGSCYGSTNPTSVIPGGGTTPPGRRYGFDFPDVSVRDTVRLTLHMLRDGLEIGSVKSVIGGSFGGMQALEFGVMAGSVESEFGCDDRNGCAAPFVRSIIPIACGAEHTTWQIAISETQRQAIYADPKWNGGDIDFNDPPTGGLSVARMIGMVSYRTPAGYVKKFGRNVKRHTGNPDAAPPAYGRYAQWDVRGYLEYQGTKFLSRFDAVTYVKLTEQMDAHDVGRNRDGGKARVLSNVRIPALVLGIDSDVLYPLSEQEELVELLPNAQLKVVHSDAGHDGFLLEQEQVASYIEDFLDQHY